MNLNIITVVLVALLPWQQVTQTSQGLNQTDSEGRKQGHWIKKYPSGNKMYDGFFKDDKPTGEFRRYYDDNTLKSVLVFNDSGTEADATLFYPNGFVASSGKYINQRKEGNWKFFSFKSKGLVVSEVEFTGDKRNGLSVKFYPDSTIAEKTYFKNDLKHGESLRYYPSGILNLRANYVNGKLHGKFEAYFENSKYEMTGRYNNDLREGEWLIFKQDGSQRYKLNYTAGKPDINDLDIYESNYFDSLGRIKVKIADPDKTGEIW